MLNRCQMVIGLLTGLLSATHVLIWANLFFCIPLIAGLVCTAVACGPLLRALGRFAGLLGVGICLGTLLMAFTKTSHDVSSGKPITIVLPAGYHGPFSIVRDRVNGKDLVEKNGGWLFEIPADGVLRTKDDSPFYSWHRESVVFPDGSPAVVQSYEVRPGKVRTGPNSWEASTDYDGTIHEWTVAAPPKK